VLAFQSTGYAKTEKRAGTGPKGITGSGAVCVMTGAGRTTTSSHRPWNTACRPGNITQRNKFLSLKKTLKFNSALTISFSVSKNNLSLVISWSKVSGFKKYTHYLLFRTGYIAAYIRLGTFVDRFHTTVYIHRNMHNPLCSVPNPTERGPLQSGPLKLKIFQFVTLTSYRAVNIHVFLSQNIRAMHLVVCPYNFS
jgi:hypothetical protein